jgi:hypothetical protein
MINHFLVWILDLHSILDYCDKKHNAILQFPLQNTLCAYNFLKLFSFIFRFYFLLFDIFLGFAKHLQKQITCILKLLAKVTRIIK